MLTDFGLSSLRACQFTAETEELAENCYFKQQRSKVYRAPELHDVNAGTFTAPADVYAFAIILIEIATREDPYNVSVTISNCFRHRVMSTAVRIVSE